MSSAVCNSNVQQLPSVQLREDKEVIKCLTEVNLGRRAAETLNQKNAFLCNLFFQQLGDSNSGSELSLSFEDFFEISDQEFHNTDCKDFLLENMFSVISPNRNRSERQDALTEGHALLF